MRCEEIDYQIHGNDLQVFEVELDPGETVIAEAGAMNWMGDRIACEAKMGDGSAATRASWASFSVLASAPSPANLCS